MSKFVSPYIKLKTTKYKDCLINTKSIALIVDEGYGESTLYIKGDSSGIRIIGKSLELLEIVNNKLEEIHNAQIIDDVSTFKPFCP